MNEHFKRRQKADHDRRHGARELPDDTDVWVTTEGHHTSGRTVSTAAAPRSYIVETPTGEIRRNRSQLNVNPSKTDRSPVITRSRTGTS